MSKPANSNLQSRYHGYGGFTLVEVVVAMGIVALMFPLIYALIIQGTEGAKKSEVETRAVYAARTAMTELTMARRDVSEYINEVPGWPEFPASGDDYGLAMDEAGRIVRSLAAGEMDAAITDTEITWVVKLRGRRTEIETPSGNAGISRVTIRVEYPARLPATKRKSVTFYRLLSEHE